MPAPAPVVVFALLGDASGSSRAVRQIRALTEAGARVHVLAVGPMRDAGALPSGTETTLVPLPARTGPLLFLDAHRSIRGGTPRADAYLASDLHVLPALAHAARRHRARLVYDAREYYPGLDAERAVVRRAWGLVERLFVRRADAVLTVNGAIADAMRARYHIARPTVVMNVADAPPGGRPRTGELRARLGIGPDRPLALYQGLFRRGRGLLPLVRAMAHVPEATLALVGEGPQEAELREAAAPLGGRVRFVPFTPPAALARLTPDADLGVIVARPRTESLRMGLPNKLFEYAAGGVPTLAGAGIEPLRAMVERYGAGEAVDPDDGAALAAALRRGLLDADLRAERAAGARRLHVAHTWDAERARFLDAFRPPLPPARP